MLNLNKLRREFLVSSALILNQIVIPQLLAADAQAAEKAASPPPPISAPAARPGVADSASRYRPERFAKRATLYYDMVWGVDSLSVKYTESGEIIRFAYHVVDGVKAKPLNDKKAEPVLIDPQAGVRLVVPSLEQVGLLRQTPNGNPEAGKAYWMAFSNKGRRVKRGDHVNVVIGQFHADGLVVE